MADLLAELNTSLQRSLDKLKNGQEGRDIYAALHNHIHDSLPEREVYEQSAKVVDLLYETLQLLEPSTLVLADFFFGYSKTKCLCTAVEFDIPGVLRNGPKPIAQIATESGARPDRLGQVLRLLVNHGVFAWDKHTGNFSNNRTSQLLLRDHWTQWHNWVDLYGNQFYDIARGIPASCRAGSERNAAQHNFETDKDMFTYFQDRGWTAQLHRTLTGGAAAQAPGILADYPWSDLDGSTFLDVGGGTGGLVALVLREHPEIQGGIFDLPSVIEQASTNFHASDGTYSDVGSRVSKSNLISGDFLKEVPSFEVYTMKWCLHDWNDSKAIAALRNIRKAIRVSAKSRLIVLESILTDGRIGHLTGYADINMMTTAHSGQERSEDQFRSLALKTGWELRKIYPLRNSWPWAIELVPAVEATKGSRTQADTDSFPAPPARKPITTEAVFLEPWDHSKGSPFIRSSPAVGYERTNINWVTKPIQVRDARPFMTDFSLHKHGFSYRTDPLALNSTIINALRDNDKSQIEKLYYPHIEDLIKRELGGQRVVIFDHTTRQRNPGRCRDHNAAGQEQPATMVHCDQSGAAARKRLEQTLAPGEDVDTLLSTKRAVLVNVWRPLLQGPVQDWPLGTIDYRSLRPADIHDVDLWTGTYENHRQTMAFEANDAHAWWYLHGHRTDEVTLIKIWDSRPGDGAKFCAHVAFQHPNTPAHATPRQSVEVRCFVILDK